jgi:hypothetical protein
MGRALNEGSEEVEALEHLAGGIGAGGDGDRLEVADGPLEGADDDGAGTHEAGDEGGGDGGGGPIGAVDDDVIALAAQGADAGGEGSEPDQPPVEGDDAVRMGVAGEDAGDLGVDEDVHLRGLGGGLEGGQERGGEKRLSDPVVDADEEDALGGGEGSSGHPSATRAPEEGGSHESETQLRPRFEPLVPDHRGADHSRQDRRRWLDLLAGSA